MSNSFIMTESIVRPAKMPYGRLKDNGFVGIEGEHAARALVVETKDDLSAFASVNLIIDDLDCGAMTKTTSGNTTTLSMTLTSSMIGRSGRKICQLIMVNSGNAVVQKSSQFEAYVGRANEIERSVDDGVTIIILSEAVTEMAREAAAAAAAAAAEEAVADVVEDCQAIADAASASADAAAQSASDAQTAAASIVVDATLDPTSTHAIQNKAVASEISSIKADLVANRSGTLTINPIAYYKYTQDGVTEVDFSTMPLNTYTWCQFSNVKSALLNANFPLSWSDTDYVHMVRLAAASNSGKVADVSIIRVFNFTKIQSAEMLYFATSSLKYRWLLPTTDLTKQYFPADAKAVGDALALKANITDLRNGLILTDVVGAIVSVAETYFDVGYANGTNLVYQQKHSTGLMAYNPYYVYDGQKWGTDEDYDGKPCIHCAQFVMALLKGIRYQDSRYVTGIQGKNKISQWAWSPDHLYPINYGGTQWANFSEGPANGYTDGYMDLNAMADYAQSHGLLRSMEEHDINVSPGDLIFEGTDVESISDLDHVSIALHVGMESKNVQIVESCRSIKYDGSGVGIRTRTVSFSDIDYYASLPLKTSSHTCEIICNIETQKSKPSQHETTMNVYRLNDISFRPGFYTFVMQADVIGETNPYVTYKLPGPTWFTHQEFVNSSGNYIATVYISSELVDNDVQINVPANVGIDVNKLIVVKGYINADINLIKT